MGSHTSSALVLHHILSASLTHLQTPSCHQLAVAALPAHGSARLGVETLPEIWYMGLVLWVLCVQSCRVPAKGPLEPWGDLVTQWPWAVVQAGLEITLKV